MAACLSALLALGGVWLWNHYHQNEDLSHTDFQLADTLEKNRFCAEGVAMATALPDETLQGLCHEHPDSYGKLIIIVLTFNPMGDDELIEAKAFALSRLTDNACPGAIEWIENYTR